VTIALRTQQLIAHESGADRVVDLLGGSYYVEYLTDEIERRAVAYLEKIDERGRIVRAVEEGYPQKELAESAFRYQREVEARERLIVGVNAFQSDREDRIPLLQIDDALAREQIARLEEVRRTRDPERHRTALAAVEAACRDGSNLVPPVLEAVKAYATLGEVCDVFRRVFGVYREAGVY
jgi:methylmalonyl-CoA mutase N-terminal domain/subunit